MRALLLLAVACKSSDPADVPDDHRLHDLSSETDDTRYVRYGGKQVEVADIPLIAEKAGLPVRGTADFVIDIAIPMSRGRADYTKTEGSFTVTCTKCQLGDDQAKLVITNPFGETDEPVGIPFGHLAIDRLDVKGTITGGKLRITSWALRSPDVEVNFALSMRLAKTFGDSRIAGCVRFKRTETLRDRDPRTFDLLSLTGAARDADGVDHIALEGTADNRKWFAKLCGHPSW